MDLDLIPEQREQLELLDTVRDMVLRGEIIALFVVGESSDGKQYFAKGTAVENKYGMLGFAVSCLMERTLP